MLDARGQVVGILGGSMSPGVRAGGRVGRGSLAVFTPFTIVTAATPISLVPQTSAGAPKSIFVLQKEGALTPELFPHPSLTFGGTAAVLPKNDSLVPEGATQFSRRDPFVHVFTIWDRKEKKNSKGLFSAHIYDATNQVRMSLKEKKVSIPESPSRIAFTVSPATLEPGIYRVDVHFNAQPVWRTFFTVVD